MSVQCKRMTSSIKPSRALCQSTMYSTHPVQQGKSYIYIGLRAETPIQPLSSNNHPFDISIIRTCISFISTHKTITKTDTPSCFLLYLSWNLHSWALFPLARSLIGNCPLACGSSPLPFGFAPIVLGCLSMHPPSRIFISSKCARDMPS